MILNWRNRQLCPREGRICNTVRILQAAPTSVGRGLPSYFALGISMGLYDPLKTLTSSHTT